MGDMGMKYEELRKRQVEENKKKMDLLKLNQLSITLRESNSPQSKQLKRKARSQEGEKLVLRRSNRVANLPGTSYKESFSATNCRLGRAYSQRRDLSGRVYASPEARAYAENRADAIQAELDPKFPSFVKPMTQSHVTGGFWLGLPTHFCRKHLPKRDEHIMLEDENGDTSETLFLARKAGLSAGWRGFSISHELVDGDALVFQLIKSTTFKVYIIRASEYTEDDQ
ncbi:B3 DNA binding domain-containing protein [Dioscorea alata]|uniref:B3 DNA binding domain-containing protein n=1 Tax=Dioscorea alata TaxID=55571 RepID=A0ACB7U2R3_DIOAL|nr:B3 DNA binding domain-containing protein [Dioscorea alata]